MLEEGRGDGSLITLGKTNLPNPLISLLLFFTARKKSYLVSSSKEKWRSSRASRTASPFLT
jgi:hypothetical protein